MAGNGEGNDDAGTSFGERLRRLRLAAGLTQEALAERSGISVNAIGALENGRRRRPRRVTVDMLADGLGLTTAERARWADARHQELWRAESTAPGPSQVPDDATVLDEPRVPDLLPADAGDFTGRLPQIGALVRMLDVSETTAVVVSAVSGRGGIGKTALAVHVAHRLRERFPDGLLYASLHGTAAAPREPSDVLGSFLRVLGVDGRAIPDGIEARIELYRARLAGRRLLVVLDDAAGEWQVRPLLPGHPACAVLVTSRAALFGLEGARHLELDMLASQEAVALLGRLAGPGRVAAETRAALEIVRLCDHLPLAVRIAGARLAARPHWTLRSLVERLLDERRRLDELVQGDLEVRASIELSYRALDGREREAFRRLGLLDASDFPTWVAGALLDLRSPGAAEDLVERLCDARLVDPTGSDHAGQHRFRIHDLLRVYARERVAAEDAPAERDAALRRTLSVWSRLTGEAERLLLGGGSGPNRGSVLDWELDAAACHALLGDPLAWFDVEWRSLVVAVEQACAAGLDELAIGIAAPLATYFIMRGYFAEWRRTHERVLALTRRTGNRGAEAVVLRGLGDLQTILDRYDEALACYSAARSAFHDAGHRNGEMAVLLGTGKISRLRGQYPAAAACFDEALAISVELDDRSEQSHALHGIGSVRFDEGRYDDARVCFRASLSAARDVGNRNGEARALSGLGNVDQALGRLDRAGQHFEQALALRRELGDLPGEGHALQQIGELRRRQGRWREARRLLERSLAIERKFGDRFNEASALQSLGELHRATESLAEAMACLNGANRIYEELRAPLYRARTLSSLGAVHELTGDAVAAEAARGLAAGLFAELGLVSPAAVRGC